MAPAGCQNHDTQVMNNNIHNGLYQITIIPCKTELDVLPPSKPLLVLVTLGIRKIVYIRWYCTSFHSASFEWSRSSIGVHMTKIRPLNRTCSQISGQRRSYPCRVRIRVPDQSPSDIRVPQ